MGSAITVDTTPGITSHSKSGELAGGMPIAKLKKLDSRHYRICDSEALLREAELPRKRSADRTLK